MFGECHAHVAMDAVDYAKAMARHENGPDEEHVRAVLAAYRDRGIAFIRDGGDKYGVSARAKELAAEYDIDYRSPMFAIHKMGHYGSIVGRGFTTLREYAQLVDEAARTGADFIKIMTAGIMDFADFGKIMCGEALEAGEVREMVHIAHEEGLAVMVHVNGARAVQDAVEAGAGSVEHANYLDATCIDTLAHSETVYVPTACVARNLIGSGRFDDAVPQRIWETSHETIAAVFEAGGTLALGSDAGAVGVPHGQGAFDEYACLLDAVGDKQALDERLLEGERVVRERFARR